jgi:Holliday junction resolvase
MGKQKKDASARGRSSKNKGKEGEREVAKLLQAYGFEAKRGVQYQGGTGSPDVAHNMTGFHIEVKRTETLSIYEALKQANADKKPKEDAIVFHRRNGKPWLVILEADAFLKLADEVYTK